MYIDKPPVDDGVYLANIIRGFQVEPVMAYTNIPFHSSSPFSSFGIMYANFCLSGIMLGGVILGMLYVKLYEKMVRSINSMKGILIYAYLMMAFGLSIHAMLSLLIPGIIVTLTTGNGWNKTILMKE
jgi:hypothetical protein